MKVVTTVALACMAVAVGGCAESNSSATDDAPVESSSSLEEASTATEAPEIPEARAFVASFIPEVKSNIRDAGADLFGTPDLKCAATGGPETECVLEIPYRRLDECGIATSRVFVIQSDSGISATEGSGEIETRGQVCYIGANGEPVPEMP